MPTKEELKKELDEARQNLSGANMVLKKYADWKEAGGRLPKGARGPYRGAKAYARKVKAQVAKLRKRLRSKRRPRGAAAALAEGRRREGVTEDPSGSNWGPVVSKFIKFTGYTFPVPWCGCFVAWCAVKHGKAAIPVRIRLGYTPYICQDAKAGANGLKEVGWSDARGGDLAVFNFGSGEAKHVGLIESVTAESVTCIEGNTSPSSGGSQANGGGVFKRTRPKTHVICVARPNY